MDNLVQLLLSIGALSSLRMDETVNRQAVMSFVAGSGLMFFTFVRDATEMSIPEAYAVSGLSLSTLPREAVGANLASGTPPRYAGAAGANSPA